MQGVSVGKRVKREKKDARLALHAKSRGAPDSRGEGRALTLFISRPPRRGAAGKSLEKEKR